MKLISMLPIIPDNWFKRQPMICNNGSSFFWSSDDQTQTWDVYLCLSVVSVRTRPLVGIICSINLVSPLRPCFMPPMVWHHPGDTLLWYITVLYSTVQNSTVQYSTPCHPWCGTTQVTLSYGQWLTDPHNAAIMITTNQDTLSWGPCALWALF